MRLQAERLHDNRWVVRPAGAVGTIGWHPRPWVARFVNARSADEAIRKTERTGQ